MNTQRVLIALLICWATNAYGSTTTTANQPESVFYISAGGGADWHAASATEGKLVFRRPSPALTWGQPNLEGYLPLSMFLHFWDAGQSFANDPPNAALSYREHGRIYHAVVVLKTATIDAATGYLIFDAAITTIKDDPYGGTTLPAHLTGAELYIDNIFVDAWDGIKKVAVDIADTVVSYADELENLAGIALSDVTQALIKAYHGVVAVGVVFFDNPNDISLIGRFEYLGDKIANGIYDGSDDLIHFAWHETKDIYDYVESHACQLGVTASVVGILTPVLAPSAAAAFVALAAASTATAEQAVIGTAKQQIAAAAVPIISNLCASKSPTDWQQYIEGVVGATLGSAVTGGGAAAVISGVTDAVSTIVCNGLPSSNGSQSSGAATMPSTPPVGFDPNSPCYASIQQLYTAFQDEYPANGACWWLTNAVHHSIADLQTCAGPSGDPSDANGQATTQLPYSELAVLYCPPNSTGINVWQANYGVNVGAPTGDLTYAAKNACNGQMGCMFNVAMPSTGDPAPGQNKEFSVVYTCGDSPYYYYGSGPVPSSDDAQVLLTCDLAPLGLMRVVSATYGYNADLSDIRTGAFAQVSVSNNATLGYVNNKRAGNVTALARQGCDFGTGCPLEVSNDAFGGDPAPGTSKAFVVSFECSPGGTRFYGSGVEGDTFNITCNPSWNYYTIVAATYGFNKNVPWGNLTTPVQNTCAQGANDGTKCAIPISTSLGGDPAPGQTKDFVVTYLCNGQEAPLYYASGAIPSADGSTATVDCTALSPNNISVISATVGGSTGATFGNVSSAVRQACNGTTSCALNTNSISGTYGTFADFSVAYQCVGDSTVYYAGSPYLGTVPFVPAISVPVPLSCPTSPPAANAIQILDATYGANNGAAIGNWSSFLTQACQNVVGNCTATLTAAIDSPFPGKAKDFVAHYRCGTSTDVKTFSLAAPAANQQISLTCP